MLKSFITRRIQSSIQKCSVAVFEFFKAIVIGIPIAVLLVACGGGGGSADTSNSSGGGGSGSSSYNVGGTVTGLTSGTLVLNNNGGDPVTIAANTSNFNFTTPVANGGSYVATVSSQPVGKNCLIANASGTVSNANVTNIAVTCTQLFTKQMGVATKNTYGRAVATDTSGNIYVAGYTTGGLDGNTLTGTNDLFLTKYDSAGNKQYTKQMGVASLITYGYGVATDASGNVYVAGYTTGGLDGNVLTGTQDLFVIKYDSAGNKLYTKLFGVATKTTNGMSVATDASGNVYFAGYTNGALNGIAVTGLQDFFLIKCDSSGNRLYTKQMGVASKYTYASSVTTDASGNVYVTGYTTGGLDGNSLTGTYDLFLVKYDSAGTKQYTKQMGVATKSTYSISVATDASGNAYIAGYTNGGLDGNTLTGTQDLFVIKYNSLGTKVYTKLLGVATKSTSVSSVVTDASGNVYVAGDTNGGLDGNTLAGSQDLFVTKYDSSGNKLYTSQTGVATASTTGTSIAVDASNNVFVAGHTNGGIDGNVLTGTRDFILVKYNSAGVKQ